VLEYASKGRASWPGRPTASPTSGCCRSSTARSSTGGTTSTRWQSLTRSDGPPLLGERVSRARSSPYSLSDARSAASPGVANGMSGGALRWLGGAAERGAGDASRPLAAVQGARRAAR
jgi:hypothetical protein